MTDPDVSESVLNASRSLLVALQVVGTAGFALSGAMAATRRRMDPFGIIVLGVIVAVGGGTTRDVLLDRPPFWFDDWWVLLVAAVTSALALPLALRLGAGFDSRRVVLTADALGLAVFAVLGCDLALDMGVAPGIAIALGVVTGIVGGILRDLLVGNSIAVFGGQVYALAAVIGSASFVVLQRAELHFLVVLWVPILLTFALRMWAIHHEWELRTPLIDRIVPGDQAGEDGSS